MILVGILEKEIEKMRNFALPVAFALALLTLPTGCGQYEGLPLEACFKYGLTKLGQGANDQNFSSPELITINSKAEQDEKSVHYWSLLGLSPIDYSRYQLLIVQSSLQADSGYETRITGVNETEQSIVVDMETVHIGGGVDADTNPYALFRINRSSKPYVLGKTTK